MIAPQVLRELAYYRSRLLSLARQVSRLETRLTSSPSADSMSAVRVVGQGAREHETSESWQGWDPTGSLQLSLEEYDESEASSEAGAGAGPSGP